MEVVLTKENFQHILAYLKTGEFINSMNDFGLTYEEMYFVLHTGIKNTQHILSEMEE